MIKRTNLFSAAMVLSLSLAGQKVTPYFSTVVGRSPIENIIFNDAGDYLLFNTSNKIIYWSMKSKTVMKQFKHTWNVKNFALDQQDGFLFSNDGELKVFSVDNAVKINNFGKTYYSNTRVAVSPDGLFFAYSIGNSIKLRTLNGEFNASLNGHTKNVICS